MPGREAMTFAISGASSGSTPSRRSPMSTMRITLCVFFRARAASPKARAMDASEIRLVSHTSTASAHRDGDGALRRTVSPRYPLSRRRRRFSIRESATARGSPESIAPATSGCPHVDLFTATNLRPDSARRRETVTALCASFPTSMVIKGYFTA